MNLSLIDLGIGLSAAAGLGVLLAFLGIHQLTWKDVDLADRLSGWGFAPRRQRERSVELGSLAGRVESMVTKQSFAASIQRDLARANLKLTVSEYLLIHVGAVGAGALLGLASGRPLAGVAFAVLGFYTPRMFVGFAQRRRLKAFNDQLADTLMLMANSLRAGYSLLQAMEAVSREAPEPTAEEFGRVVREVGLGLSPEEALLNLHRRLPTDDLDLMVTAINVQHEVGGNLSKIFDSLGETIRERNRIFGEIKTLTAQQRMGGYVIVFLPVVMGAGLFLINPDYLKPLFTSQWVICMPAFGMPIIAGLMMVAGFLAIRRIVAIEV